MYTSADAVQTFTIATPGYAGTYRFAGTFESRGRMDPWCWFHTDGTKPHLTLWASDFDGEDKVRNGHLSYPFGRAAHKPVHLHFRFDPRTGAATFKSIDAARCGDAD